MITNSRAMKSFSGTSWPRRKNGTTWTYLKASISTTRRNSVESSTVSTQPTVSSNGPWRMRGLFRTPPVRIELRRHSKNLLLTTRQESPPGSRRPTGSILLRSYPPRRGIAQYRCWRPRRSSPSRLYWASSTRDPTRPRLLSSWAEEPSRSSARPGPDQTLVTSNGRPSSPPIIGTSSRSTRAISTCR